MCPACFQINIVMLVRFDDDYLPGTFVIFCYCGCMYYQQFMVCVQIMEARAMLTLALDKRSKEKKESDLSTRGNIPSKREGTRSLCFKYSSEDDIGVTCDLSLRSGICN